MDRKRPWFFVAAALMAVVTSGLGRSPALAAHDAPLRSGPTIEVEGGVVVSASGPASTVGAKILRRGGNAVDASIATAFALAVTLPSAGNIGGGGFMLVHPGRRGRGGDGRLPRDCSTGGHARYVRS